MFVGDNDHGDTPMNNKASGWYSKYSDAEISEILDEIEREESISAYSWRRVTGIIHYLQNCRNEFKNDGLLVLQDRLEHVMTDRNNLELRLQELEEALSQTIEEKNAQLAEAEHNIIMLDHDLGIAEQELRLARKEICHMACSEDLFSYKGQTPVEVAYYMGWDCFKEDGK